MSDKTAPLFAEAITNSDATVFDWLETELTAISCWHHGSPSYEHDANWMKDCALKLIAEARKIFAGQSANVAQGAEAQSGKLVLPEEVARLIAQLRDTPNWMKESFGHWKDATLKYDRAPKDAADLLERLYAAPPAQTALTPEWLWSEFMDYCQSQGIAPAHNIRLFEIVKRARALLEAAK